MHVNKSLKLLKKINSIFHTIMENSESVSALEQELLKSYVVQFYDSLTEEKEERLSKVDEPVPVGDRPKVSDVEEQQSIAEEAQDQERPAMPAEPVAEPQADPVDKVQDNDDPVDLLSPIFTEIKNNRSMSHIGERLISDLKKSMGLNDKLLYANTLFDGNQSQLLETLEKLNEAADLDSVRSYLNSLAHLYDWTETSKLKSTTNFLHLVLRKFSVI